MSTELKVIDPAVLSETERKELDTNIEALITAHKNNRQEINRLVFDSVAAMTMGEDYERQLANKKGLKRFLGGITGSNKKLQDKINSSRATAQYAAQQTLQRLAEQNLMSFDLIAAVNNKLNASVIGIENEINEIYEALTTFFKQSKSDIIKLESRVERLERNVNLLNWQNAIEYQMFNGVEYPELDNVSKIVCLTRDFYDITKGEWTTSDLLLLKTAMSTIEISPRDSINFYDFIQRITYDSALSDYLLGGKQIQSLPEPYLIPLLGMKKLELLDGEESYVVDTIMEQMEGNHISVDRRSMQSSLARRYLRQEAQVDVDAQVNHYDLIMEMLFNLQAAENTGVLNVLEDPDLDNNVEEPLEVMFQRAAALFKNCELKEAHPLLIELSDKGYARANALLYWLYCDGYPGFDADEFQAVQYAEKGYRAGDVISSLQYALDAIFLEEDEKISIIREYKPQLLELVNNNDVFAVYMMAICYLNDTDQERDGITALKWLIEATSQNFYRAFYSITLRYYYGDVIDENLETAILWVDKAVKFPQYLKAIDIAIEIYSNSGRYEEIFKLYKDYGIKTGRLFAKMGSMFERGLGIGQNFSKATEYYEKAAELGSSIGQRHLAICYLNGRGVPYDREKARFWLEKSAAQRDALAIDMLKDNF